MKRPTPIEWSVAVVVLVIILTANCDWAGAATLNVPSAAYPTIQRAIYAAADGDTIQVAAGTYRENVTWDAKSLQLIGAGPADSIVDGDVNNDGSGDGACLTVTNVPATARVEGFTFRNGRSDAGGGISCVKSSLTLQQNTITANEGGGISCDGGKATISGNTITANKGGWGAGGIRCVGASPSISKNNISRNRGSAAGGICCSGASPTIEGNTISENSGEAGGILCKDGCSPVIRENTVVGNHSTDSAIYCEGGNPTIRGNTIRANEGQVFGGGIGINWGYHVSIEDNEITGNKARYGGGIKCDSESAVISRNRITGNAARGELGLGDGGGIVCAGGVTIEENTISGNTAGRGGGILVGGAGTAGEGRATIGNNMIRGNTANEGGGIHCIGGVIKGNIVTGNKARVGGGVYMWGSYGTVENNTISGNVAEKGAGVCCHGATPKLVFRNTIVAFSIAGEGVLAEGTGRPTFAYCDVFGSAGLNYLGFSDPTGSSGNISADPLFADTAGGDFRLRSTGGRWTPGGWVTDPTRSPCIDAGDPASPFANEPVPNGGRINMGFDGNTPEASKTAAAGSAQTNTTTPGVPVPSQASVPGPWLQVGTKAGEEILGPDGGAMVWVSAGEFVMGSQETGTHVRRVRITNGFWIGRSTVTNMRYRQYCQKAGIPLPVDSPEGDDHPVVGVGWTDAKRYCEYFGVCLPTEAQWEYAARGAEARRYPWGNVWDPAMCCNRTNQGPNGRTFAVGSFPGGASWCGALDMAGNVTEWCADWYQPSQQNQSSSEVDPEGPATGEGHVRKGFASYGPTFPCAQRMSLMPPDVANDITGFRCAFSPAQ
ncbi:MAG: SUMF1/EgtB/PvdO family nonheme iron enzyme [Armatimonadia bacterium]